MKKHIRLFLLLLVAPLLSVEAQTPSTLTLHEAVIGSYGSMRPAPMQRFTWLPEGSAYSYMMAEGDAARLVIKDAAISAHQEITLSRLNRGVEATGYLAMRYFPVVEWISNEAFLFDYYQKIFSHNIRTDETQFVMDYDAEAQNTSFEHHSLRLAYTKGNNLFVQLGKGEAHQVTHHHKQSVVAGQAIHRYEFGIEKGIFWSPMGELLAFYEKDESAVSEFPIVDYAADPTALTNERYPLAGRGSEIPRVGVFNPQTKEVIYLKTDESSEKYLTNLTWSPDGAFIYLAELNRSQNELQLVIYNAGTGDRIQTLFSEGHEKYIEPQHGPVFIPDHSGDFLWFSYRNGYQHLYRYNGGGKLIRQITDGAFDVAAIAGFTNHGRTLIVTAHQPVLERNVFLVNLKNGRMNRITQNAGYHSVKKSADDQYLMVQWTSPEIPAQNDLYSFDGTFIKTLHHAVNPLENKAIGVSELTEITAEDGTVLYGRLIKPSHFDPTKKYPVLVYVYGGPHVQMVNKTWLHGAALWKYYLAEQGYLVFVLDNRGSANRGLDFEQAVHRKLGTVEIQDQLKGVEYLKNLPFVDANKMAVYGWSYGGFMSISLMLRTPGVFQAAVAGGAVTDWRSYEVMYTERYMGTPDNNPDGYTMADLKQYASNLSGDLLMIHGTSDNVVILDHSMDLLKAFIDQGKQIDYFLYPGHGHNVMGRDRLHLIERVIQYIMDKVPSHANPIPNE